MYPSIIVSRFGQSKVDVNPQDNILSDIANNLGLPSLSSDDDSDFTSKWYFWVIIGIVICIGIVMAYFTLRGFRRCLILRRKQELERESELEGSRWVDKMYHQEFVVIDADEVCRRTARPPESIKKLSIGISPLEVE